MVQPSPPPTPLASQRRRKRNTSGPIDAVSWLPAERSTGIGRVVSPRSVVQNPHRPRCQGGPRRGRQASSILVWRRIWRSPDPPLPQSTDAPQSLTKITKHPTSLFRKQGLLLRVLSVCGAPPGLILAPSACTDGSAGLSRLGAPSPARLFRSLTGTGRPN